MSGLPTPEQVWHERLRRAERGRLFPGFARRSLEIASGSPTFLERCEDGRPTRVPNPYAGDPEATAQAMADLFDQHGVELGIGRCPRSGPLTLAEAAEALRGQQRPPAAGYLATRASREARQTGRREDRRPLADGAAHTAAGGRRESR